MKTKGKLAVAFFAVLVFLAVFFVIETSEHEPRGKAVEGVSPDETLRARCFRFKDGVGHYRFELTLDDILNGGRLKLGTGTFVEAAYQRSESPMPVIIWPDGNKKVVFVFDDIEIVMNAVPSSSP